MLAHAVLKKLSDLAKNGGFFYLNYVKFRVKMFSNSMNFLHFFNLKFQKVRGENFGLLSQCEIISVVARSDMADLSIINVSIRD